MLIVYMEKANINIQNLQIMISMSYLSGYAIVFQSIYILSNGQKPIKKT